MIVQFKRLPGGEHFSIPSRATPGSAGLDLQAAITEDVILAPGMRKLIPTGFAISLPSIFEAQVRPRSGNALKRGLTVLNSPGTIDSDYRGEIGVILINHGDTSQTIQPGDRIAQLVIVELPKISPMLVQDFSEDLDNKRMQGGFGSTN
jgi:dUTP pyrophosphatase